jgi:hypothetical protein
MACHNFVLTKLQMILKTLCAFLALILEPFGAYGDGEFKWNYGLLSFSPFLIIEISKTAELEETQNELFIASDL